MTKTRKRLTRDAVLMITASMFSLRSTCIKGNGAVLAKGGRIIAVGYNGSPAKMPHCLDVGCELDDKGRCIRTLHAEMNVILMAAKYGISTEGCTIYCTTFPCPHCAKILIGSGIKRVVYSQVYSDMSGHPLFTTNHIEVSRFDKEEIDIDLPSSDEK